jgi:outer membrane protein
MKKIITSTIVSGLLVSSANAFMGLNAEVGTGVWAPEMSGKVGYGTSAESNQIDLKDLGLDDGKYDNTYIYADFSHFVPFLPNARVESVSYEMSGSSTISKTVNYGDESFTAGDNVKTDIKMSQTDMILYWGVPFINTATVGVLDVNFGLDAKNIDGEITLNDDTAKFDETLPLLYLNARIDLPFAPINIEGTTKSISYDGASISDNEIKVSGVLDLTVVDLKVDLGYRIQNITIPTDLVDDLEANIDTKGMFFGVSAKF